MTQTLKEIAVTNADDKFSEGAEHSMESSKTGGSRRRVRHRLGKLVVPMQLLLGQLVGWALRHWLG